MSHSELFKRLIVVSFEIFCWSRMSASGLAFEDIGTLEMASDSKITHPVSSYCNLIGYDVLNSGDPGRSTPSLEWVNLITSKAVRCFYRIPSKSASRDIPMVRSLRAESLVLCRWLTISIHPTYGIVSFPSETFLHPFLRSFVVPNCVKNFLITPTFIYICGHHLDLVSRLKTQTLAL